jgi:hypothetical protein
MRRDRSRSADVFLIALAAAASLANVSCGGGGAGDTEPAFAIEFERRELLEEATQVAIYFYTGEITCEDIRATLPHPQSVLGPFVAEVDENGRTQGITFPLPDVPVGVYVVFVDAIDASGTVVGSGCAPGQQVFEGEVSRIRIKIS